MDIYTIKTNCTYLPSAVLRQNNNKTFASHSTGESLTWLATDKPVQLKQDHAEVVLGLNPDRPVWEFIPAGSFVWKVSSGNPESHAVWKIETP